MTARQVEVCPVMGTVASAHVVGHADSDRLASAIEGCFGVLRRADRVFSMYDEHSCLRRIARGELRIADADPWVGEIEDACDGAEFETRGLFSAHLRSGLDPLGVEPAGFDPTGYVKGWATELAAREHLAPLLEVRGVQAVGLDVGGDLQVFTAEGSDWTWNVGIVDPADRSRILGTVPVRNGAVATSGNAERGAHILDPRTGAPATGIRSATVIADSLTRADVWATAAVAAGRDLSWLPLATGTSGLLVDDAGGIHRWIEGVTVEVQPV